MICWLVCSSRVILFFYTCWNKLISRQLVAELRFRNIKQEDLLFCGQLFFRIQSLLYLNDPLYIYHDHPSSLSKDFSYIGPHQTVKVLSILLEETPKERKKARGVILMRMFRRLMTSSYFVAEWPFSQAEKDDYRNTLRTLLKRYQLEYFIHPYVSLKDKISVLAAMVFPRLFGWYLKRIAGNS